MTGVDKSSGTFRRLMIALLKNPSTRLFVDVSQGGVFRN